MRFSSTIPAGEHERFTRDAGRSQIGKSIPINRFDGPPIRGTIVDARPNDDGTALLLTINTGDTGDTVDEMRLDGHRCGRPSGLAGAKCATFAPHDAPACLLHLTASEMSALDAAQRLPQ